ncbi:MAG: SMC-Scp complex subunit ScpB [Planctomycetaceae bacterium]|nr:SMC-Scp complex subunit ScpB [Planctomycetaceae bacterium]
MTSPSPNPPKPKSRGLSLDALAQAFAQVMGVQPRRPKQPPTGDEAGHPPAAERTDVAAPPTDAKSVEPAAPAEDGGPLTLSAEDDSCPITPRTILEAMLFVGTRDNQPLTPARAAELMRDVGADEVPTLVQELNRRYDAGGAAYRIVGEGDGYRLALRDEFHGLRDRFFGRIREARLSQAAVDILALVAYQQPITAEKLSGLRGKPCGHLLSQLVRRGLLRIERPEASRRTPHYFTTDRFLHVFHLESLADLPRSEDPAP